MSSSPTPIFCCPLIEPYRPEILDHERKFRDFISWARFPRMSSSSSSSNNQEIPWETDPPSYAVQFVRQVNYGPLEAKRYFVPDQTSSLLIGGQVRYIEVTEKELIRANFQKLNSYKNFKCTAHDKFFEVNLYQKDPVNKHHWRATVARPAAEIDL